MGEEPRADSRHVCVLAIGPFTPAEAGQIRSVTFIRLGRVDELGERVGDGLSHACDAQVE
jgi:ABC-type Zn2+ transport system substrate-binding protein/surface adhesin